MARTMFNLTFVACILVAILVSMRWGFQFAAWAVLGTVILGIASTFIIGLIMGAASKGL